VTDRSNRPELGGRIRRCAPTLVLDDGRLLGESNAILWYFAKAPRTSRRIATIGPRSSCGVLRAVRPRAAHAVARYWLRWGTPSTLSRSQRSTRGYWPSTRWSAGSTDHSFFVGDAHPGRHPLYAHARPKRGTRPERLPAIVRMAARPRSPVT
jgi:hypothetical protein